MINYQVRKNAYDFQNIISKTSKQIVLNFETNFKLAKITILGCIETLFDSVLSLKKESKNSLKSLPLYLEVEDFIRDLAKLGKLVQIPCRVISKQKELLHIES